jgi:hypothetical protein
MAINLNRLSRSMIIKKLVLSRSDTGKRTHLSRYDKTLSWRDVENILEPVNS